MIPSFRHLSYEDDLQTLKKSLVQLLPSSSQMLNIVNLKIQDRFSSSKGSQVDFYLFEEDHNQLEDNTQEETVQQHPFVLCIQRPNIWATYCILIVAPPNPSKIMMEAFEKFVEWDKVRLFGAINQSFFADHLQNLCLRYGKMEKSANGLPCESYAMDHDFAMSYTPRFAQEQVGNTNNEQLEEVKELSVDDSLEVISNYPYGYSEGKVQVEESIRNLTSTGVYVNSELASSALLTAAGLINILYTDEKHRRKGYGNIVMKALSKSVASMGLIPMAECEVWNDDSRKLLKKLGFRFNSLTTWVHYMGHANCK